MMPDLEQKLSFAGGASYYLAMDILSGSDYLRVQAESRQFFCFGYMLWGIWDVRISSKLAEHTSFIS